MEIPRLLLLLIFLDISGHAVGQEKGVACPVVTGPGCPQEYVNFWLYTRHNPYNPLRLDYSSLSDAQWTPGPLKVLIHGYTGNKDNDINAELRPAYLASGDYNVVSVDWSDLTRKGCYMSAILNMRVVARCVGDLILALGGNQVHLLGFSLGAHLAALASENVPDLHRLTKLEPANPLISRHNSVPGRAQFVDVYHCNAGILGQQQPSGHLDVYFNNQVHQPGCGCSFKCSHDTCLTYFAESIDGGKSFKAFPSSGRSLGTDDCSSQSLQATDVGEHATPQLRGSYTAFTEGQSPDKRFASLPGVFKAFTRLFDRVTVCPSSPIIGILKRVAAVPSYFISSNIQIFNALYERLVNN